MQTFDFQKPGEMTKLERNACLSYYNHHYQDKASSASWQYIVCACDPSTCNSPTCPKASPCAFAPCTLLHSHISPSANLQSCTQGECLRGLLQEELLTPDDLLIMCKLGNLLVSRPMTECISHAEALQQAHSLAMQWLHPTASHIASLDNNTSECFPMCFSLMSTCAIQILDSAGVKWQVHPHHPHHTLLLSLSLDVTIDRTCWQLHLLLASASTQTVTDLTVCLQWSKFPNVWSV